MPANQLNFDSIIPAVSVGKSGNYISIPSFSYTGIIWKQASELVVQYNYTTTKNFVISELPIKPAAANFIICIKFRVGTTVYRYKLWTTGTEILPFAPQYTGQLIKKNCVIEIWNVNDGGITVSSASDINIATSIRTLPVALSDLSDVKNAEESSPLTALQILTVAPSLPTTYLWAWYRNDVSSIVKNGLTLISSWLDTSGNGRHLVTSSSQPEQSTDGVPNTLNVKVSGTKHLGINTTLPIGLSVFAVCKNNSLVNNAVIFGNGLATNGEVKGAGVASIKAFDSAGAPTSINAAVLTKYVIINYGDVYAEDAKIGLDLFTATNNLGTTFDVNVAPASTSFFIGDKNGVSSNDTIFYEIIILSQVSPSSEAVAHDYRKQVLQYLAARYDSTLIVLPQNVSNNVAWLDNN